MTQPSELDRARHDCAEGEALLAAGHPGEAARAFRSVLTGVGAFASAASLGGSDSDGTTGGGASDGSESRATGASDGAADSSGRAVDASRTADSPERIVARACVGLGRALLTAGKPVRAAAEFRQATRLDPAGLDPLYWLGCAAAHQGAYATAEQRFSRVLELSAGHGPSLVQRGYVRVRLGRTADALADLRSAERTGALDAEARWVLAALSGATARDVARLLGAAARAAMTQAQDARAEGPSHAATPHPQGAEAEGLSRSKTAQAQNSGPEGRPWAATPQAQNTTPADRHHAATTQLQDAGPGGRSRSWSGWSRAVALLDRARQLDPDEREFVPLHAVALCLSGRRDEGLAVLTAASHSVPADRHLAHALAVMAWHALPPTDATGREAARAWARCVSLWAGLLHDTAFWERLRADAVERYGTPVDDGALATLRTDLQARLEALVPEGNGEGSSVGRPSPEVVLSRESEAARLLAEAGGLSVAVGAAPLVCGPLRIVELGREGELGAFVAEAGEAASALRRAFSHLGFAQALLRLDRPQEALTALSGLRCPSCRARGTAGDEVPRRDRPPAAGAPGHHPADGAQETVRPPDRPNETAAHAPPQSQPPAPAPAPAPAPDDGTAPRSEATPAPGSGHQPAPDQGDTARSLPTGSTSLDTTRPATAATTTGPPYATPVAPASMRGIRRTPGRTASGGCCCGTGGCSPWRRGWRWGGRRCRRRRPTSVRRPPVGGGRSRTGGRWSGWRRSRTRSRARRSPRPRPCTGLVTSTPRARHWKLPTGSSARDSTSG
ncbi:hypothetical protein ACFYO0_18735 [Streptomyces sp. NPDC006365]|uniref:tetratricopeptide repeat protein n=1 Tax=Streptomyces sp. NPDC006365 TaxID=3364744 RepID=UPI0036A4AD80